MPDISQIKSFHLKVIFLIHFIFISLSSIGSWSSFSYLFYNGVLILFIIWGIYHYQSEEPLQLAIAVNALSIIFDIIILAFDYPTYGTGGQKLGASIAILHLIVRPCSTFVLIKLMQERLGSSGSMGEIFGSRHQSSYEDIDRTHPTHSGGQAGGYDFNTAQQI